MTSLSRRQILDQMEGVSVLILGDVMLDEYLFGEIHRISPEAPVPVVALGRRQLHLGGAGNVASNIAALGGKPTLIGVVGEDVDGQRVEEILEQRGIKHHLVRSKSRPTTRKTRVLAGSQHMIRLDQEDAGTLAELERAALVQAASKLMADVRLVVLSDYAKGVISRELCKEVIALAREKNVPVIVDPKSIDFTVYAGATFITPNSKEAAAAAHAPSATQEEAISCGRTLAKQTGAKGVLVTRGDKGMVLVTDNEAHFVDVQAKKVFDVTGAGDTVIATFSLAIAVGADPVEAMALSNFAAAIVVGQVGAATCTREEIIREAGIAPIDVREGTDDPRLMTRSLMSLEEAAQTTARWRAQGRRVVFANGCFDVLHAGHVILLEEARARGDALVIGLNGDASVRRLKGPKRPIQELPDRARVLAGLRAVDAVVAFDEETPLNLILALKPDVLVKGDDYAIAEIVGAKEVQGWGGEVAIISRVPNRSTTTILAKS